MAALVIKSWRFGSKPVDDAGSYVRILARRGGLLAWLLAALKVDPTTRLLVGLDRLEFTTSSLSGMQARLIPLESLSSTFYGFEKPLKAAVGLFTAFALLASALMNAGRSLGLDTAPFAAGCLGLGLAVAVGHYLLNRTLTLGFVEASGLVSVIQFKRSVIEGVDVTEDQARQVCKLVQRLIEAKHRRRVRAAMVEGG